MPFTAGGGGLWTSGGGEDTGEGGGGGLKSGTGGETTGDGGGDGVATGAGGGGGDNAAVGDGGGDGVAAGGGDGVATGTGGGRTTGGAPVPRLLDLQKSSNHVKSMMQHKILRYQSSKRTDRSKDPCQLHLLRQLDRNRSAQ